jgi:hypothetical protein
VLLAIYATDTIPNALPLVLPDICRVVLYSSMDLIRLSYPHSKTKLNTSVDAAFVGDMVLLCPFSNRLTLVL